MKQTVRILVFKNEIEADLLHEILDESNIPHMVRTFHDSAYDGMWQTESCWGFLDADEKNRDEILRLYNEMSKPDNIIEPIE